MSSLRNCGIRGERLTPRFNDIATSSLIITMLRSPLRRNGQKESSTSLLIQTHDATVSDNDERQEDKLFWPDHPRQLARTWTASLMEVAALLPLVAIPAAFVSKWIDLAINWS